MATIQLAQRKIRETRKDLEEKLNKQSNEARNESSELLNAIRSEHDCALNKISDEEGKLSERIRDLESRAKKGTWILCCQALGVSRQKDLVDLEGRTGANGLQKLDIF